MARIGEGQGFTSNDSKKAIYAIIGNNLQIKVMACALAIEGQKEGSVLLVTDTWKGSEPITGCRLHRYSRIKQHFEDYRLKPISITQRGHFSLVLCDFARDRERSFKIKSLQKKCLSGQQLRRNFRVYTIYRGECKVLELLYSDGGYKLIGNGLYDLTLCGSPIIDEDNFKKYVVGILTTNAEGKAIPRFFSNGVLEEPAFTTHPKNHQTLREGENITFSSDANGIPEPSFTWTKDGSAVTANDRISLSADNKKLNLTNVNRTDSGEYRCVATNGVSTVNSNAAILTVHYQPEFTEHPQSQTLVQGSSVTFSSDANGVPEPTFSWTKDGSAVTANDRISLSADHKELSITNVNRTDSGEYRCVATNSVNTSNSNAATLTVQDAAGQHQWYQRGLIAIDRLIDGIQKIADIVMKGLVSALVVELILVLQKVKLHYYSAREHFLSLMEDIIKDLERVKQRLEKEFKKVGCKGELELTLKNKEEVYKAQDHIRARMAMSKREGEVPTYVEVKEDLDQMRKGTEELIGMIVKAKEDLDQMRKGTEELIGKPLDPRKRDVHFTTASSGGEQTMRKDVECEIPAAAVADVAKRGGSCSKVFKPLNCTALHYNQRFNPENFGLDDTLSYKCSSQTEWEVTDVCAGNLENTSICNPDCSLRYQGEGVTEEVAKIGGTCSKPLNFTALHYNQTCNPRIFGVDDILNYKCSSQTEWRTICNNASTSFSFVCFICVREPSRGIWEQVTDVRRRLARILSEPMDVCRGLAGILSEKRTPLVCASNFENTSICYPCCSLRIPAAGGTELLPVALSSNIVSYCLLFVMIVGIAVMFLGWRSTKWFVLNKRGGQ